MSNSGHGGRQVVDEENAEPPSAARGDVEINTVLQSWPGAKSLSIPRLYRCHGRNSPVDANIVFSIVDDDVNFLRIDGNVVVRGENLLTAC